MEVIGKEHIEKIDKCFLDAAPRATSKMVKTKYFRGMTQKYDFDFANEIKETINNNFNIQLKEEVLII